MNFGKSANVRAAIDREKGTVEVSWRKTSWADGGPQTEISWRTPRHPPKYEIGEWPSSAPRQGLRRIRGADRQAGGRAAQPEAERGVIYEEYIEKENEILTASTQRVETPGVRGGAARGVARANKQMPARSTRQRPAQGVLLEVTSPAAGRGAGVPTHSGLVKRLFEIEGRRSPGHRAIKSIARAAATAPRWPLLHDQMIDPVGS